jgi:molybdate transport system regulatory protein
MSRRVAERPRKPAPRARRSGARLRVKLWLESGGKSVLCRHMSEILQAVDETGSIKEAAAAVGRSYRFVWSRIKESEKAIGAALVETHVGGRDAQRSRLTPLARDLVTSFEGLRSEVSRLIDGAFSRELKETLRRHGCRG